MFNFANFHFIEINHEDSTVLCFYDKLISENVDTYQNTLIISCMIFNTKSRNRFYIEFPEIKSFGFRSYNFCVKSIQ